MLGLILGLTLGERAGAAEPLVSSVEAPATIPNAATPAGSAGEAQRAPIVVLAVHGDELPKEQLRAAISRELERTVVFDADPATHDVSGTITVSYRRAQRELAVTWDSGGHTVSRVIAAAEKPDDVVLDSALLAGNLARRQEEELLPAPVTAPPLVREAPVAAQPTSPRPAVRAPEKRVVTASLFYPLATHYERPDVTSNLDLNLIYGRVGAVEGVELGLVNVVTRPRAAAPARLEGLQFGLAANVVTGDVTGLQMATLFNLTAGDLTGIQASIVNVTHGEVGGLQGAFLFNRAGSVSGLQLSPVNLAGDVDGVQIGLVNVARRVRGASIGLVNVAEDIDGIPLAPISVTKTGGVHPSAWSGTSGLGNAGVKFATRRTYTLFFGSYHQAFERKFVGGGVALGGRIPLGSGFHADIDACGTYLIAPENSFDEESGRAYKQQLVQPRLRMLLGFRAARHFGLFLGGAAVGQIRSELDWDRVSGAVGPELVGGVEL